MLPVGKIWNFLQIRKNKTAQIPPASIDQAGIKKKKNLNPYKLNPDEEIMPNRYPTIADIKSHKLLNGNFSDKILK